MIDLLQSIAIVALAIGTVYNALALRWINHRIDSLAGRVNDRDQ